MNPMIETKISVAIMEIEKQMERGEKALKTVTGEDRKLMEDFVKECKDLHGIYNTLIEKEGRFRKLRKTKAFARLTWKIQAFKRKWKKLDPDIERIMRKAKDG